jgi:hypothetical protein
VLKHGNFALSIDQTGKGPNWLEQKVSHDIQIADDKCYVPCAHAELNSKQSIASGSLQANSKGGGDKGSETELFMLENTAAKTVKRTKLREGSADED